MLLLYLLLVVRLTRAKLFSKSPLYGRRDYFVLLFRNLLYSSSFVLFLNHYSDSSEKFNELRYLAAHDSVRVRLLLRRWLPSIFLAQNNSFVPFECSLLVLHGTTTEGLFNLLQKPQFHNLLEYFPFAFFSCKGLLSQDPLFLLRNEFPSLPILVSLQMILLNLVFIISYYLLGPLVILQNLVHHLPRYLITKIN